MRSRIVFNTWKLAGLMKVLKLKNLSSISKKR
ncbi:hypothetical protein A2U01_0118955, partial [Trifolium medium]|nr:hypothetical protein [Trifolium medium]